MLIEKQRRLEENEEELDETHEEDNRRKTEENLLNNKEFYQSLQLLQKFRIFFIGGLGLRSLV